MLDRYIPKGASKVADKHSDAIAYLYADARIRPAVIIYAGKSSKPLAHWSFRTEAERAKEIERVFENRRTTTEYVAKRAAERKAYVNNYQVGEILVCSWGYEQTNIDYYEVTASKGKMVTLRKIGAESVGTAWCQEDTVPLPGKYIGDEFKRRASDGGIKIASYSSAHRAKFELVGGVKVYRKHHATSYA